MKRKRFDDPEQQGLYEEARARGQIGLLLNDARIEAGLSIRQLAAKVGTSPGTIHRLIMADYEGHSMRMIHRVAAALGRDVVVTFPRIDPITPEEEAVARARLVAATPALTPRPPKDKAKKTAEARAQAEKRVPKA
jgi:transcriptional regulator with XRE-family HTH domain